MALLAAGCSSDSTRDAAPDTTPAGPAPAAIGRALAATITKAPDCDWLDTSQCLFPFPSSRFEQADPTTVTKRRLAIPAGAMPVNAKGVAVDPGPFARNDGWGVGTPIMVTIANVDLEASKFPNEADPSSSVTNESGTVVVDMTTGTRLAHWAEVDDRPELAPADRTTVLIHPLTMLPEGHRIAVGIRGPIDFEGKAIAISPGFRVVRDRLTTKIRAVESRRAELDRVVDAVAKAGMARADQWLAWDFMVMSTENLTGDLITMRDRAFAQLAEVAPAYRITQVQITDDDGSPLPEGIAKRVRGTYDVPSFLSGDGAPGTVMVRDDSDRPKVAGTYRAEFVCSLTAQQMVGIKQAKPVVYGHGLLGSFHEAERGDLGTAAANHMLCATNWVGMSDPDIGFAVGALQDINNFPSVADRLQQGIVNQLFLARLLNHPRGLSADREFQTIDRDRTIDTSEVFYEGHSQGGIMGIAATAVSTEWTKAVIGVPGIDYALLIPRSNNWQKYGPVIAMGYPGKVDGLLTLALLQQQWDRGEGSGYARYLTTKRLPGTPAHQVLMEVALGDHQVANATAEVAARTAGVPIRLPAVAEGRLPWKHPPFQMKTSAWDEDASSLLVYWDAGTLAPPLGNRSPDMTAEWKAQCTPDDESAPCADPHEFPRRTPDAQRQRNLFFDTGLIKDLCGNAPCLTEPR
ncbi:MAG: hypothetical protein ABIP03_07330 [Aquihabitans sp.]